MSAVLHEANKVKEGKKKNKTALHLNGATTQSEEMVTYNTAGRVTLYTDSAF